MKKTLISSTLKLNFTQQIGIGLDENVLMKILETSPNRAYLATANASAQIPRYAQNFRYAQPLYAIGRLKKKV